jgi:hypothetical protein
VRQLLGRFSLKNFVDDDMEDLAFLLLICAVAPTWFLTGVFHVKSKEKR